jgi:hypothetical protein
MDDESLMVLALTLEGHGPTGEIASFMLRAQIYSDAAKSADTRSDAQDIYSRKNWAMQRLYFALKAHAASAGLEWGWGPDPDTRYYPHVLYVDVPTGQISFHSPWGGQPQYTKSWDGSGDTRERIIAWAQTIG